MAEPETDGRLGRLLKALGLSLLNATILLFLLLVLSSIWLVERLQSFTAETAAAAHDLIGPEPAKALTDDVAVLNDALPRLARIDEQLATMDAGTADPAAIAALRSEVQALRADVDGLKASIDSVREIGTGSAKAILADFAKGLAAYAEGDAATDGEQP